MNANLFAHLEASIADANRTAMTEITGKVHSCGDLIALAGQLANVIVARGVKPGDRVAVQVEKSVMAIGLYLATVRAGAVFLPLNPAYTFAEVGYFIDDAQPALIVCEPSRQAGMQQFADAVGAVVETLDDQGQGSLALAAATAETAFATVERSEDDLAAILYTSGTTGRSKGAMLSHRNLTSNLYSLIDAWQFTADDVLIHALPIYHTHGLFVATNVGLFSGARIVFLPKFDAEQILNAMPSATVLMGVPTFYVRLLQSPALETASAGMRLFISGSAPLLAETHEEWRRRTGHAILERYGMTETNMNTSNPYVGDRIAGTVGKPLPSVIVQVTDPTTGEILGPNEIGMIEVKGPNVFRGYWKMPQKTAEEFRNSGFFVTGDLGKIDDTGYLHIVGRQKDLIITGGFNVYPKEIEEEIDALPGVVESAVIGVAHPDFGEGVTAIVIRAAGSEIDESSILKAISERIAKFKLPKKIIFVSELPRNAMGKVQKNILRERCGNLYL